MMAAVGPADTCIKSIDCSFSSNFSSLLMQGTHAYPQNTTAFLRISNWDKQHFAEIAQ